MSLPQVFGIFGAAWNAMVWDMRNDIGKSINAEHIYSIIFARLGSRSTDFATETTIKGIVLNFSSVS
jgi:hypothetical protein